MEIISVETPQFKHRQVEAEIRQLVGTLPMGARLPSERSLALAHGVNFLTVRRALKSLVDDGSVIRKVGSGTFVAKHAVEAAPAPTRGRIGILAWQDGGGYAHRVAQGIALAADAEGVEIRSAWTRGFTEHALAQAKLLAQDGCEALILPWFPHEYTEEARGFVRQSPLPVSLALSIPGLEDNCFERADVFCKSLQDECEQLCEYFRLLGHKRIAFLGPDTAGDEVLQRMLGAYLRHTSLAQLPSLCGLVRPGGPAMDQLAERWRGFRGDLSVICYDDGHALRFMTAMHKLGLGAPTDFQIVGHNDSEASRFSDPPLTTLRQNFGYIGLWLIKNARALARGERDQSSGVPRPELLVRASCGGAGRIDEALRSQLPGIKLTIEPAPEVLPA